MEPVKIIIILCYSAFTGWLISWLTLQLLFTPSKLKSPQSRLAAKAGSVIQHEFESSSAIEEKIADPLLFEKLKPEIEKHVDYFLNEKLAMIFPLLYKFMGEKTLAQFKQAFMIEIDLLFPVIIRNYMSSLKKEIRLDNIVSERISQVPVNHLRGLFFQHAKKEIFYFRLVCVISGSLMGLFTVLLLHLIA